MGLKDWYKTRVDQPQPVEKTQPPLKLPQLNLPRSQGAKILSTPAEWRTAEHERGREWPTTEYGPASGVANDHKTYIRGSVDPKRIDAIAAHEEMHKMFGHVEAKYGLRAKNGLVNHLLSHTDRPTRQHLNDWLVGIGYDPKSSSHPEEVFNYFHSYMVDPLNRERIQGALKSPWRRQLLDRNIKQGWRKMLDAAQNVSERDLERFGQETPDPHSALKQGILGQFNGISKSISTNDWETITGSHDFNHANLVDHTAHVVNSKPPKAFKAMIEHPEPLNSIGQHYGGISAKTIHDTRMVEDPEDPSSLTPSGTIMIKPYHKKLERGTQLYGTIPISGWSTMTTKNLFNAGGIGHLAEDVSAAEHQGVPVTVHTFGSPDSVPIKQHGMQQIDPMEPRQIAVMDYLTNNLDRHGNNLMVGKADKSGFAHVYGIDHERNFQYFRTSNQEDPEATPLNFDTPAHYLNSNGVGKAMKFTSDRGDENARMHQWWKEKGPEILNEMNRNLASVKDQRIREHVSKNFQQRWDAINEWAKRGGQEDLFSHAFPTQIYNSPIPEKYPQKVDEIMAKIPQDKPYEAANILADYSAGKLERHEVIDEAVARLMDRMSNQDFAQFFLNHYNHPTLDIKSHAVGQMFGGPTRRNDRLKAIVDKLGKMPDTVKKLFPFLQERPESGTPLLEEAP